MRTSFQLLPSPIIQTVLHFLDSNYKLGLTEDNETCIQLLTTCSQWRLLAQELLFNEHFVSLRGTPPELEFRSCLNPPKGFPIAQNAAYFAKQVLFHIEVAAVFTTGDSALAEFAAVAKQLQAARSLHVYLEFANLDEVPASQNAFANICKFVARLKQLLPGINKLLLYHTGKHVDFTDFKLQAVNMLSQQLATWCPYTHYIQYMVNPQAAVHPSMLAGFSSITCDWGDNSQSMAMLICSNAMSLDKLSIIYHHNQGFSDIFQDGNGNNVEYPQLKCLKLFTTIGYNEPRCTLADSAVPFPNLCTLLISGHYPFADNTPFRGNHTTLECLHLPLDWNTLTVLTNLGTFTKTPFKQLRYLQISDIENNIDLEEHSLQKCVDFATSIAHLPLALGITGVEPKSEIISALQCNKNMQHVSRLNISACLLQLPDLVTICQSLPVLTLLQSSVSRLSEFKLLTPLEMLDAHGYFAEQCPLARHLAQWNISGSEFNCHSIAMCAIFVALACPNFVRLELLQFDNVELHNIIRETAEHPAYHAYRQQISVLYRE